MSEKSDYDTIAENNFNIIKNEDIYDENTKNDAYNELITNVYYAEYDDNTEYQPNCLGNLSLINDLKTEIRNSSDYDTAKGLIKEKIDNDEKCKLKPQNSSKKPYVPDSTKSFDIRSKETKADRYLKSLLREEQESKDVNNRNPGKTIFKNTVPVNDFRVNERFKTRQKESENRRKAAEEEKAAEAAKRKMNKKKIPKDVQKQINTKLIEDANNRKEAIEKAREARKKEEEARKKEEEARKKDEEDEKEETSGGKTKKVRKNKSKRRRRRTLRANKSKKRPSKKGRKTRK